MENITKQGKLPLEVEKIDLKIFRFMVQYGISESKKQVEKPLFFNIFNKE